MTIYEKNAEVLKILSHPVRIQMMEELITRGTCNVNQIVDIMGLPQSTVSQHLAKMKSQKIVTSNRKGLEVYYSTSNEKINTIVEILLGKKLCSIH
ncbi:transcriptional regulator [Bacillus pseudomycoides]|uniref:Transcriptional regulator n=1 Tax=Bacillus pseudomycoides TaxID=64104 RepID=A0AA91VA42_9BACI|nr:MULTISPECIES: metalloregulator ArsR/SmtB family transcription factor [Bacillus]PEB51130.1 transcriptional regulator [Bacillus sp. AFS098217]PED81307.1 transcriptional regulator [Bacillus pseudomycoides]PEU16697.1 transcriptional regulator [Bacillus sp. AFS019443]PEU21571.1 transcriptional regulator [Bacillus sp. AFS014408]PFW58774.1 transcriptional regulator [Bacillus sp. AFS075034]